MARPCVGQASYRAARPGLRRTPRRCSLQSAEAEQAHADGSICAAFGHRMAAAVTPHKERYCAAPDRVCELAICPGSSAHAEMSKLAPACSCARRRSHARPTACYGRHVLMQILGPCRIGRFELMGGRCAGLRRTASSGAVSCAIVPITAIRDQADCHIASTPTSFQSWPQSTEG